MRYKNLARPELLRRARARRSPPAAATTAAPAPAARARARPAAAPPRPAAPSTAPARRSRRPSTRSGPPASRTTRARPSTTRPSAPAAASRSSRAGTVDFGATDSAMKDEEVAAAQKKGAIRSTSRRCSAPSPSPTTSTASTRASSSTARPIADIFLGKIKKWNDPKIASQNSGTQPAEHEHHGLPPLRRVGHDEELHRLPRRLLPGVEERPRRRQDGQVADRHRRQGQRRRRRLREADRGRGRLRRAGLRAAEQLHVRGDEEQVGRVHRAVARVHVGRRRGRRRRRTTCASARSTRRTRRPTRSPPSRSCSSSRTRARPARARTPAKLVKSWLNYALGDGQQVAPQLQYAPLPATIKTKAQAKVDALQCNGEPPRSQAPSADGSRDSISARRGGRPIARAVAALARSRSGC